MKCSVDRDELLRHLQVAGRGISTRSSIQVLSGIQLAATGGELHLASTDMEISVRTRLKADIEADGVAVVPGKLLLDIVRHLDGASVEIELRDGMLSLASEQSRYTLHTFEADDFPQLPPTTGRLFTVDRDVLLQTIQSVADAASQDDSRPVITGVKVHITAERMTMVATDSYRLSAKDTRHAIELAEAVEAVVPARALKELARITEASLASTIAIGIEANQALFGIDDTWVTARRIEGQFPNHTQLIPQSFEHEAVIDRAELLDVVNRIRVMAQRNSPLRMHFDDGTLTLSAIAKDVGAATETLPIRYEGEELTIGFNADFLRDGVQSMGGDTITIKLINPLRPGLLTSDDESLVYLIMPVRLQD